MVYFVFAILIVLFIVSLIRGFRITAILKMTLPGIKRAFIVVQILLLIGMLTGLWRSSGTISYFVSFGIHILPQTFFVLSAFLLTALMSLAIGTSFGVAATAGGILSMAAVSIILLVSGSFSEIIHQTGLFEKVYVRIEQLNTRIGRFATVLLLSIVCCMVFCNQTISIMMVNQLTSKLCSFHNCTIPSCKKRRALGGCS